MSEPILLKRETLETKLSSRHAFWANFVDMRRDPFLTEQELVGIDLISWGSIFSDCLRQVMNFFVICEKHNKISYQYIVSTYYNMGVVFFFSSTY